MLFLDRGRPSLHQGVCLETHWADDQALLRRSLILMHCQHIQLPSVLDSCSRTNSHSKWCSQLQLKMHGHHQFDSIIANPAALVLKANIRYRGDKVWYHIQSLLMS